MSEWIISSSALILVIIAVRYLFRGKISLRLQYAVWLLALLRLLIPVPLFQSPLPALPQTQESEVVGALPAIHQVDGANSQVNETQNQSQAPEPNLNLKTLWYFGMGVTFIALAWSNISFAAKLRRTRRKIDADCPIPVYVSHGLQTPCMLWHSVYITPETEESSSKLRHALAHEYTHYRHGDGLWSLLRCVCLVLHWYNPLVWWAAALSRRDGELACDEDAIRTIGEGERLSYGRTLIDLTAMNGGAKELLCCATTMTGGKRSIKERVSLIAKKPKNIAAAVISVILICALAAGCSFGGAQTSASDPVQEIKDSISFTRLTGEDGKTKDAMTFTVPDGVKSLRIQGRMMTDAGGMSYHYEFPAEEIKEGKTATFSDPNSFGIFTELTMTVIPKSGDDSDIDILALYNNQGSKGLAGTITFNVEGKEETVPATYWNVGAMAILVPTEGWSETAGQGSALTLSPNDCNGASVSFQRFDGDRAYAAEAIEKQYGCKVNYIDGYKVDDINGYAASASVGKDIIDINVLEIDGTYAVICRYPKDTAEGWGTRLNQIAKTLCLYAGSEFAPAGLTAETSTGVGVILDYADKNIVVFHGYFGLFVYDLNQKQTVLAFDLMKTTGSTNIQGSEGSTACVSKDGKTVMLWHYTEDGKNNSRAMYIDTTTGSYRFGDYEQMKDPYTGSEGYSATVDGKRGEIKETDGTLGGLEYVWGDNTYRLFENYFK